VNNPLLDGSNGNFNDAPVLRRNASNGNFCVSFDPQNAWLPPLKKKKKMMTFSCPRANELAQN
jgi:hypothetical protein